MKTYHLWNESRLNERRTDTTFTKTARNSKLSGYKGEQEWSMNGYGDMEVTVVEDREGVKLQLKHIRAEKSPYDGDFNFW